MLAEQITRIQQLKQIAESYQLEQPLQACTEVLLDMERDTYTFIVVGEFSTGKSSFINALIGESIIPTGITPTTSTINVIQDGESSITIHYLDGRVERVNDVSILKNFIASKLSDVESINYIDVFQPLELLKDRVMIIDTPGLNDVNELRSDITYQYIPRADVVFFLLDCRTPLRKSEYEFLTETLVAKGLERIVFIVNFADDVDEAELPFIIEKIERNLKEGLSLSSVEVIAFSAVEAMDGLAEKDDELLEISGYYQVKEKMLELCKSGIRVQEKQKRYEQREMYIRQDVETLLVQQLNLSTQNAEQLQQEMQKIEAWKQEQQTVLAEIDTYYEERVHDFKKMASKSVATFFDKTEETLIEEIQLFQGSDFNHFFEKRLPSMLNNHMKKWIEQYSPQLQVLVGKLEDSLNETFSSILKGKVYVQNAHVHPELDRGEGIEIELSKRTDPLIASGLIVGGTSALFLMLGGPILLPIIGMVGLPYLQKKMLNDQLNQVKPQVISDLQMKMMTIRHDFEEEVHAYLEENCERVYKACLAAYDRQIQQQMDLVKKRMTDMQKDEQHQLQMGKQIQQQLQLLQSNQ